MGTGWINNLPEEYREGMTKAIEEETARRKSMVPVGCASGWDPWVPVIEQVEKTNGVQEIDVTPEEFERLKAGGLEELKSLLSAGAADRLMLMKGDSLDENRPYVLVCHYGRCP